MLRATVGLVEDSDEDFALFSRVFSPAWDMERWSTGEAAIAAFEADQAKIASLAALLVDHDLPGINGLAVIQRVRASATGDLPVICMVSGTGRAPIPAAALAAGADAFLPKPDRVPGLRALVHEVERLVEARREPEADTKNQ